MNIVFLGTPEFAVPTFRRLLQAGHNVLAAVSQPDREKNRKGQLLATPVKAFAEAQGIPVYQFNKISREGADILRALHADLFVTAAYGQILSREILDIPRIGVWNVHASLLPKYRGSSPIQWALLSGETRTGITVMRTEAGVDTGDIILQQSCGIADDDNAETLSARLAELGAETLVRAIEAEEAGQTVYTPQGKDFTYFPMLKKSDGHIDFNATAQSIKNRVRGLYGNPGCYTFVNGEILKIHRTDVVSAEALSVPADESALPGAVLLADPKKGLYVRCAEGSVLRLTEIQASGGRRLADTEFLKGKPLSAGTLLGNRPDGAS